MRGGLVFDYERLLLGCGELAHMTHSTFQHVSPDGSLNNTIPFPQKLPIYQQYVPPPVIMKTSDRMGPPAPAGLPPTLVPGLVSTGLIYTLNWSISYSSTLVGEHAVNYF